MSVPKTKTQKTPVWNAVKERSGTVRVGLYNNSSRRSPRCPTGLKYDVYLNDLAREFPDGVYVLERMTGDRVEIVLSPTEIKNSRRHSVQDGGKIGFNSRLTVSEETSIQDRPWIKTPSGFVVHVADVRRSR